MAENKAVLITQPTTQESLTVTREVGARTAVLRGFSEYLSQLVMNYDGKSFRFRKSVFNWAEPEEMAEYPSVACWTDAPATYDSVEMAVSPLTATDVDKRYLIRIAEMSQAFNVTAWATGNVERGVLEMMLQDAIAPVQFMYGVRLMLPWYHGAHAEYCATDVQFEDNEQDDQHRLRRVTISVKGSLVVYRAAYNRNGSIQIPLAQFKPVLELQPNEYRTGLQDPATAEVPTD